MIDAANDLVTEPRHLGVATEAEVLETVLPLRDLRLIDIGCGGGRVSRLLAARGARVTGVEPDPVQAAKNREAEPEPGLEFVEAPGEALPFPDASFDGAVFSLSLHHVPADKMAAALTEARRVLRPSGFLCVFEPLLSGTLQQLFAPFHNETPVRKAAYAALAAHAAPFFAHTVELTWEDAPARYDDFESFVADNVSVTHMSFRREAIDVPEVRRVFEAGRDGDDFAFTGYGRANIFREPVS